MSKKEELPAMPFYWGDWFKSPDVQSLPRETKCVWFEMLGRMWESTERGYLTINLKPMTNFAKARALGFGEDVKLYLKHENILRDLGLFSVRSDGAIYSRKILHINELREKRRFAGYLGGKQTQSKSQANGQANTENENETVNETVKRNIFIPPTLEEVKAYCKERKNNVDPQAFIDHYETNNWFRGKTKIKNWNACVRTWEKNDTQKSPSYVSKKNYDRDIESKLGKIATKEKIKFLMREIPENIWWKIESYLRKRYPSGGNGFIEAEREIIKEKRENVGNIDALTKSAIPKGSGKK